MRGGTKNTYIFSLLLCDFVIYILFTQGLFISNAIFSIDVSGWQTLIWIYMIAQIAYLGIFYIAMANRPWSTKLKFIALFAQFMLISFSGFFIGPYLT